MGKVNLPGWLWIVVLVGGPMLAAWLEQYFGGQGWAAPAAGLLVIVIAVAKAIQEWQREPDDKPLPALDATGRGDTLAREHVPQRSYWSRVISG